jgi:hypothetical protein
MKNEIDENIPRNISDEEFEMFISKLSLEMAKEIKKRKIKKS